MKKVQREEWYASSVSFYPFCEPDGEPGPFELQVEVVGKGGASQVRFGSEVYAVRKAHELALAFAAAAVEAEIRNTDGAYQARKELESKILSLQFVSAYEAIKQIVRECGWEAVQFGIQVIKREMEVDERTFT